MTLTQKNSQAATNHNHKQAKGKLTRIVSFDGQPSEDDQMDCMNGKKCHQQKQQTSRPQVENS